MHAYPGIRIVWWSSTKHIIIPGISASTRALIRTNSALHLALHSRSCIMNAFLSTKSTGTQVRHMSCSCCGLVPKAAVPTTAAAASRHIQLRHAVSTAAQTDQRELSPEEHEREIRQNVTRRIKHLGEQRKFKEAVQELAGLATLGVQPDAQAATALLAACTRSRDMSVAQTIFDQLFGDFLQPDEITFAVMLRGYGSQSPPDWQKIDAVLTQMKVTYGLEPSAKSYNALLEVCYKTNDSDRALDVIDRMADDEVEPDEQTFEIVSRKRTWRSYMRKQFG